jgi:hypothetical protein
LPYTLVQYTITLYTAIASEISELYINGTIMSFTLSYGRFLKNVIMNVILFISWMQRKLDLSLNVINSPERLLRKTASEIRKLLVTEVSCIIIEIELWLWAIKDSCGSCMLHLISLWLTFDDVLLN